MKNTTETYMNKLVSIISPCYNGEKYISRLLDSIIKQTYKKLEIILINDGSVDNTESVIFSYKKRFDEYGYKFIYLKQDNQGQSAAINKGLKVFTGDYIAFVDSDDFLSNDAIEEKVTFMERHPNIGLAINKIKVLDFENLSEIGVMERKESKKDNLFRDLISGNNVFYTPGGYFVRSSMFRKVMPSPPEILAPREIGQNFQLFLPLAYKYPVGYIDKYLYFYLVRKNSHSRQKHTFQQSMHNWDVAKYVLDSITDDIEKDIKQQTEIKNLINIRYYRERMYLCYKYNKKNEAKENLHKLIKFESNGKLMCKLMLHIKHPVLRFIHKIISVVVR